MWKTHQNRMINRQVTFVDNHRIPITIVLQQMRYRDRRGCLLCMAAVDLSKRIALENKPCMYSRPAGAGNLWLFLF